MKKCSLCGEYKPLDAEHYHRSRSNNTGFVSRCKICVNGGEVTAPNEYAFYDGEKLVMIGTVKEISEEMEIKPSTVRFYSTPSYLKRTGGRGRVVVLI